ncbi:MAG: hypothetical protein PHQ04_05510 [Opitutaceae bacterium]|nr:hypothetical protein [Opitutaceae bacterium]
MLLAVALTVSLIAQTTSPSDSRTAAAPSKTKAQAKPAKPDPKAKEPEPKIPGMTVQRTQGGYLGLEIEEGTFKLSFYDTEKKPVAADVTFATARWPVRYQPAAERMVLNPSTDGKSLVGVRTVKAPHVFKLYLNLLSGEGDRAEVVESYVLDFRG